MTRQLPTTRTPTKGYRSALATETVMTPDAILALYEWKIGSCFRCAEPDVFVTPIGTITTPAGVTYELGTCGECVLVLENERRRYAHRRDLDYKPGTLGL